jgi:hypothetical protein
MTLSLPAMPLRDGGLLVRKTFMLDAEVLLKKLAERYVRIGNVASADEGT